MAFRGTKLAVSVPSKVPSGRNPKRYAALEMLQDLPGGKRVTVAGDKGFDTGDFVRECRNMWVTPHVAQNLARRGGSAIDSRRTRQEGYAISQKLRKRIEECFGWLKTIALLHKVGLWYAKTHAATF